MNHTKLLALLLALLLPIGVAQAEMYKWTDKNGNTVYSQNPPPTGNYQTLSAPPPPPADSGAAANQSAAGDETGNKAPDKTVQKLSKQNAETRKKYCEDAKKDLAIYQVYRRIKQKDGSVIRLSDTERQQKINQAKQAIEQFCN